MKKTAQNTYKKWIASLLFGLAFLPSVSWAQWAVTVVNCIPTSGAIGIGCASEASVAAQYTYLSTGINPNVLGAAGGALGITDGVIELLRKANDESAKGVEGQRQDMPNEDLASRQRDYSLKQREVIGKYYGPLSASACREATISSAMGGGAAGGGGASGGGTPAAGTTQNEAETKEIEKERFTNPRTAHTSLTELVGGTNPKHCTPADRNNMYPGCVKSADGGSMPAANLDVLSLIQPANQKIPKKNFTITRDIDNDDRQAALNFIKMNSPRPAPDIPEKAKGTPPGAQYLVFQKRYSARALAVSGVFSNVLAFSTELPPTSAMAKVWKTIYPEYQKMYDRNPVKTPSERELLYFMVERQYGKKLIEEDAAGKADVAYLANRNLELQKLNSYLLLKVHQQLERQNLISAYQLSQAMDPVTYQEIMKSYGSASTTKSQ